MLDLYHGPVTFTAAELETACDRVAHACQLATLATCGTVGEREAQEAQAQFDALVTPDHTGSLAEQFALPDGCGDVNVFASTVLADFLQGWAGTVPGVPVHTVQPEQVHVMVLEELEDLSERPTWWAAWLLRQCGALEALHVGHRELP